jgi:hypothetical protein
VLEDVRKAGAEVFILADAACPDPCLKAGHWGRVIFLNDDGEAVLQGPNAGVDRGNGYLDRGSLIGATLDLIGAALELIGAALELIGAADGLIRIGGVMMGCFGRRTRNEHG